MNNNNMPERFLALFDGLDRAHGEYTLSGKKQGNKKQEGRAVTLRAPVTEQLWYEHLEGIKGLGIVPIRADDTACFGAIDIDVYDLDLHALCELVKEKALPLTICRTKSGGAHCYLFTAEPVPASVVRNALSIWAMELGFPGVEIFPKQNALAGEDDVGNWINMPYFKASDTDRYALLDGQQLTADEFLQHAETLKVTEEEISGLAYAEQEELVGAPPCLQVIAKQGAPEGTRNDVLFNFGVYARLRYGDDWETELDKINQAVMDPPLGSTEVVTVIKSVSKKDYFYTCKRPPVCNFCNKDICRQREFGIGEGSGDPGIIFDSVTQIETDPPLWIVGINGVRLQMSTEDMLSQNRFAKRCVEKLRFYPTPLKNNNWRELINQLLKNAEVVEAPEDAGSEGMFWYHLEQFCTSRAEARDSEDLLRGKPWHSEGRTHFRSADLNRYLQQQRFLDLKQHQIWGVLRKAGDVKHHQLNVKGRCVQCWSVPEFAQQTEDFTVPEVEDVEC